MVWVGAVGCLSAFVFWCFSPVCLPPLFFPHRLPFTDVWTCGRGSSVGNSREAHLLQFIPLIVPLLHKQIVPPVTVTESRASGSSVNFCMIVLKSYFLRSKWASVLFSESHLTSVFFSLCTRFVVDRLQCLIFSACLPASLATCRPACRSTCLPACCASFTTSPPPLYESFVK